MRDAHKHHVNIFHWKNVSRNYIKITVRWFVTKMYMTWCKGCTKHILRYIRGPKRKHFQVACSKFLAQTKREIAYCDNNKLINILFYGPTKTTNINPYPTAFPYGNGMVLHFYQQQESSTTKTVHKVINKGLKAYV